MRRTNEKKKIAASIRQRRDFLLSINTPTINIIKSIVQYILKECKSKFKNAINLTKKHAFRVFFC